MFPNMVDEKLLDTITELSKNTLGHKLSGAGGGGYLILVSDTPIANAIQIKIRRKNLI
jgi:mevalonate kinase